jgi:hypothetical protein
MTEQATEQATEHTRTEHQGATQQTGFTWGVYGDATLAGMAVLLPIPFLDDVVERHFRRRMPDAIAKAHDQRLDPAIVEILNRGERGIFASTLLYVLKLPIKLLTRLSRKIFYVLTIHQATETLSYYWQRAFLMNYMLEAGHLHSPDTVERAQKAMEHTIKNTSSPLGSLARHVVRNVGSAWRVARHALRGRNEKAWSESRDMVSREWNSYTSFFERLSQQYEENYQQH